MIYRLLYVHRRRMVSRTTHDLLFDPVPCLSSPTVSQRLTHTQFLLSSSYLMISQGKKDEVLRVGSSRNSSAFPYISLFFFCFFFFRCWKKKKSFWTFQAGSWNPKGGSSWPSIRFVSSPTQPKKGRKIVVHFIGNYQFDWYFIKSKYFGSFPNDTHTRGIE